MQQRSKWFLVAAATVVLAACSDSSNSSDGGTPGSGLSYIRLAPTAPALCNDSAGAWFVKRASGSDQEIALTFPENGNAANCNAGSTEDFLRLSLKPNSLMRRPDSTLISTGDSVFIYVRWVGNDSILFDLQPSGLLFDPGSHRDLAERIAFASAAMGLAGLNHGLQGPTTSFLSCILLTQGISRPRPFRSGLVALGTTYLCHPLGFVLTEVLTHRNADQLRDPRLVLGQLVSLLLGASTLALLVVGGDAYSRLRRSAFEQRTIGRYRLERRLAVGPGSEVWRAHHDGLGIDVALKLARPSRGAVERVERVMK